jgi:hypothetical protein
MAKVGVTMKQEQLKQSAEKFKAMIERNHTKDEQWNKQFAEVQKKNLSQEQATQVGQAMRAIALKKPKEPEMMVQFFADMPADKITPANTDQVEAAKLQVKMYTKERAHYDDMVKDIQDYTKALVPKGAAKPAANIDPATGLKVIKTQADYDALGDNEHFIWNGRKGMKPKKPVGP